MSRDRSSKLVLCIEDEPDTIELIRLILQRRGYDVLGAAGGRAGLHAIRESKPDLVLLDLMMPDMDGWEVYRQIKADDSTRHIPVIIVSAKSQSLDQLLGTRLEKVDDYITKPFSPQRLLHSVEKTLAKTETT